VNYRKLKILWTISLLFVLCSCGPFGIIPLAGIGAGGGGGGGGGAAGPVGPPNPTLVIHDSSNPSLVGYSNALTVAIDVSGVTADATHYMLDESTTTQPDPGSGFWQPVSSYPTFSTTYSFAGAGTYTLYLWIKDSGDLVNPGTVSGTITIDLTDPGDPNLTLQDPVTGSEDYTNLTSVTVITSNIDADVSQYILSNTHSSQPLETDAAWTDLPIPGQYSLTSGDGIYDVYLWVKDHAGNICPNGAFHTIELDTSLTTPVLELTDPDADASVGWCNETTVDVTINSLDGDVTNFILSETHTTTPTLADASWDPTQPATYTFDTSTQENKTVYLWVLDKASNIAGSVYGIQLDMGNPSLDSVDPVGGTYIGQQTVTILASDSMDTSPTIYYTTDGTDPNSSSGVYSGPLSINSDLTLKCAAMDHAGNWSGIDSHDYDLNASPVIVINSLTAGTTYRRDITFDYNVSDDDAADCRITVTYYDGTTWQVPTLSDGGGYTVSGNSIYNVPPGDHTFTWASHTDWEAITAPDSNFMVRVVANDAFSDSAPDQTNPFIVDNTYILVPDDFGTIQAAINDSMDGQSVIVRDGTYTGAGNKELDFGGREITVRSENGWSTCTIDCEDSGRGFWFHNSETSTSVVDGFTIQYGSKTGTYPDNCGGAIYCDGSSPTITNCLFYDNDVDLAGGAICCDNSANPDITNCTFDSNTATYGGAIRCYSSDPTLTNCIICYNSATMGGGLRLRSGSDATLSYCYLYENDSSTSGGAIECVDWSSPTLTDCTFEYNDAATYGGAINCQNTCYPFLNRCAIVDNEATTAGGGIYCSNDSDIDLYNSLIVYNYSAGVGGGIASNTDCDPIIVNCTIADNWADGNGGGLYNYDNISLIYNTIIWDNYCAGLGDLAMDAGSSEVYFDTCNLSPSDTNRFAGGGALDFAYCIYTYPEFLLQPAGNYRLDITSPCRNAGYNDFTTPGDFDLDGKPRIVGTNVDIGAYEIRMLLVPTTYGTIQEGIDAAENGDTVVIGDGTYTGNGNRDLVFGGKEITVCSLNGPTNCIIDCESSTRGFVFNDLEETDFSVVKGLTITNGSSSGNGGAIYCMNASPAIIKCIFASNYTNGRGGAIHLGGNSETIIANCVIRDNLATSSGGGISIEGDDIHEPIIVNCLIINNHSNFSGGGISCYDCPNLEIHSCTIVNNEADINGGGIYGCSNENNILFSIYNSIIWGNTTITEGHQIQLYNSDVDLDIFNCCYSNKTNDLVINGGIFAEINSIYENPMFRDPGSPGVGNAGNYRLKPGTPCFDTGNTSYICWGNDIEGNERINGKTVDMGAWELNVIHVPDDYGTIASGISAAADWDVVLVLDGVYYETDLDFGGKDIAVRSASGPSACYIDCNGNGRAFYFHNYETVNSAVVGFYIVDGYIEADDGGGGILCYYSHPLIKDCIIDSCVAENYSSWPDACGGGIGCYNAHPTIVDCEISNCYAEERGGGIFIEGNGSPATIVNCLIRNNAADDGSSGGGIHVWGNNTYANISNCTITGNTGVNGGGIHVNFAATVNILNSIVWGNSVSGSGNDLYVYSSCQACNISYSDIDSTGITDSGSKITWVTSNINSNPLFTSGYFLSQVAAGQGSNSPCLNAGSDTAANLELSQKTTRTDDVTDTSTVDVGYHYKP